MSIRQVYVESTHLTGGDVRADLPIPSLQTFTADLFCDEDLKYLVRNCPALTLLRLFSRNEDVTELGLHYIANSCLDLEYFLFSSSGEICAPTAAALLDVLHRCSNLSTVALTGSAMVGADLDEMGQFGDLFIDLNLVIDFDEPDSIQEISDFLVECSDLIKLELFGVNFGEFDALSFVTAQSCPLLEELGLTNWFPEALLSVISGFNLNCKLLKTLSLVSCDLLDSILPTIAQMANLENFSIDDCDGVTDAGIASLARLNLVSLSITDRFTVNEITEECLLAFTGEANICYTLESLSIDIGSHSIINAQKITSALASCRNLKNLTVDWGCVRILSAVAS